MDLKKTPYKVEIGFEHGQGFAVTISRPGESRTCPDRFVSLHTASVFAEKMLHNAGFTTTEAD